MPDHSSADTTAGPDDGSEENPSFRDPSLWLPLSGALAVAGSLIFAASRISTAPWHVVLVVLSVLASLYALYMIGVFAFVFFVVWMLDECTTPRAKRPWPLRVWPFWVWPVVAVLGLAWPPLAALAGYDASEWLWQGISIYLGILVILAVFFRPHR